MGTHDEDEDENGSKATPCATHTQPASVHGHAHVGTLFMVTISPLVFGPKTIYPRSDLVEFTLQYTDLQSCSRS